MLEFHFGPSSSELMLCWDSVFCRRYAAVFAAFVAGMSATAGIDFGANFVAALAISFEVCLSDAYFVSLWGPRT